MKFNRIYAMGLALCVAGSNLATAQPLLLSHAQCREMALSHSEELEQADIRLRQAELDNRIATTAYLPKFEGSATGAYVFPDIDMMGKVRASPDMASGPTPCPMKMRSITL